MTITEYAPVETIPTQSQSHYYEFSGPVKARILAEALYSQGVLEGQKFVQANRSPRRSCPTTACEVDYVIKDFLHHYQVHLAGEPTVKPIPFESMGSPRFRLEIAAEIGKIDPAGVKQMFQLYLNGHLTYHEKRTLLTPVKRGAALLLQSLDPQQSSLLLGYLPPAQLARLTYDISRLHIGRPSEVYSALWFFLNESHKIKGQGMEWCRDLVVNIIACKPEQSAGDLWSFWDREPFSENLPLQFAELRKAAGSLVSGFFGSRPGMTHGIHADRHHGHGHTPRHDRWREYH